MSIQSSFSQEISIKMTSKLTDPQIYNFTRFIRYCIRFDNHYSCFQNKNGILAMLDEECLRPGTVTDETFLDKLNTVCAEHQHFESRQSKNSKFLTDHSLPHNCFRIQHYAGKVRPQSFAVSTSLKLSLAFCFQVYIQCHVNASHAHNTSFRCSVVYGLRLFMKHDMLANDCHMLCDTYEQ